MFIKSCISSIFFLLDEKTYYIESTEFEYLQEIF